MQNISLVGKRDVKYQCHYMSKSNSIIVHYTYHLEFCKWSIFKELDQGKAARVIITTTVTRQDITFILNKYLWTNYTCTVYFILYCTKHVLESFAI